MNAAALLAELESRGVAVTSLGTDLLVDAPKGALTDELWAAIVSHKTALLDELGGSPKASLRKQDTELIAHAANVLPMIRITYRETHDLARDFTVLDALRDAITPYEPGGNRVRLRLLTVDGRKFLLEWRALVEQGLRRDLARILAAEGVRRARASGSTR
jgi:hypothetical protein